MCRVHHVKCWAGWSTSWNQDCGKNIHNLRYADENTLMAQSLEELNSLLMKVQHTRPPYASPTSGVYSNSCPLSQWCYPTIPSSVVLFSSHLQSFPVSGSFQMSQLFVSDGQSISVSASASVLSMNIQDWFPLGWTGSPCSPKDSQESSPTPQFKNINSLALSFLYSPVLTSIHDHWQNHSFD